MRRGIDGLSAVVQQSLGQSPCSGSAFVFRNRTGNRLKIVLWDGNGVRLCQRRLHQGGFVWPTTTDTRFSISRAQWQWLIAGQLAAIVRYAIGGVAGLDAYKDSTEFAESNPPRSGIYECTSALYFNQP